LFHEFRLNRIKYIKKFIDFLYSSACDFASFCVSKRNFLGANLSVHRKLQQADKKINEKN